MIERFFERWAKAQKVALSRGRGGWKCEIKLFYGWPACYAEALTVAQAIDQCEAAAEKTLASPAIKCKFAKRLLAELGKETK